MLVESTANTMRFLLPLSVLLGCGSGGRDVATTPTSTTPAPRHAAAGIRVTGIEVNQGVGVLVWDGATKVPEDAQAAPLIAGRDAMVRVLWEVDDDFVPRDIEARLELQGDAEVRSLVKAISGPADRNSLDGTLNFALSADQITPTTAIFVELREVGNVEGVEGVNRTPEAGGAELHAWADPMRLDVTIMPCEMTCGDPALSISPAQKALTENFLMNVFPVRDLAVTWRDEVLTMNACSNAGALDELQALRAADGAGPEMYYHCVFRQSYDTLMAGGYAWQLGPEPAEPRVSLSVNWWGPDEELMPNVSHELGHNHGRAHPWTDPAWEPAAATDTGCNTGWGLGIRPGPHPTAYWNPEVADPSAVVMPPVPDPADCDPKAGTSPPVVGDVMGYSDPYWVDAYTWRAFAERIRTVSAFGSTTSRRRTLFGTTMPDGEISWTWGWGVFEPTEGAALATVHTATGPVEVPVRPRIDGDGVSRGWSIPLPADTEGRVQADVAGRSFRVDLPSARGATW